MSDKHLEIFDQLKAVLSKYSPPLTATSDVEGRYELVSKKEAELKGRTFKETYFGAVIIQKGFVGLYLMHVYAEPTMLEKIPEDLRKRLKGKSCFHISKLDDKLLKQIEKTVKEGYNYYKKNKMV